MNEAKEQIFDIYDIWYEPLLTQTWFIATLIIFLMIMTSLVLYFIYTRYFNKPVKIDPLVLIQQRLMSLSNVSIENEKDGKRVYFEITELMKEYIAYRYHISVIGLTDREIVEWARLVMPEDKADVVQKLLLGVTSIKFEHQVVTMQQVKKDIALMQEFIHKTNSEHTDCKEA